MAKPKAPPLTEKRIKGVLKLLRGVELSKSKRRDLQQMADVALIDAKEKRNRRLCSGKYQPWMPYVAQNLSIFVKPTDKGMGNFFGVSEGTIWDWGGLYPEFAKAIGAGRRQFKARANGTYNECSEGVRFLKMLVGHALPVTKKKPNVIYGKKQDEKKAETTKTTPNSSIKA